MANKKFRINKKKKNTRFKQNYLTPSIIFSGFTVLISIIALIFSWQANQIALKQSSEVVVWINTRFHSNNIYKGDATSCAYTILLTNYGGAKTAIVNFDTFVYYKESESKFVGRGHAFIRDFSTQEKYVSIMTPQMEAKLFEKYFSYEHNENQYMPFPKEIEPGETLKFVAFFYLPINSEHVKDIGRLPVGNYPWDWYENIDETFSGYNPLSVSVDIHLASGRKITVPEVPCAFILEQ